MSMEISRYKAVELLLKQGINKLPVTHNVVSDIINSLGWTVIPYTKNDSRKDMFVALDVWDYAQTYRAFSYYNGDKAYVFYRADVSSTERAELLAHELGHIVLGHFDGIKKHSSSVGSDFKDFQEREADLFSQELLAPSCILRACKARTINEVKELALVHNIWAEQTLGRMVSRHNLSSDEKELCRQFKTFISQNKIRGNVYSQRVMMICAALLCGMILTINPNTSIKKDNNITPSPYISTSPFVSASPFSLPTSPPSPAPTTERIQESVWVTKSGRKYHKRSCHTIANSTTVTEKSVVEATEEGYEPCKFCFK